MRTADDPGRDDLRRIRDFIELVSEAARSSRQRERLLRAAGTPLTGAGLLGLRVIARRPGVTASELARALKIDQSTISRQLHPLEAQNLLTRTVDDKDRRVARLTLTTAGRRVLAALGEAAMNDIDVALAISPPRTGARSPTCWTAFAAECWRPASTSAAGWYAPTGRSGQPSGAPPRPLTRSPAHPARCPDGAADDLTRGRDQELLEIPLHIAGLTLCIRLRSASCTAGVAQHRSRRSFRTAGRSRRTSSRNSEISSGVPGSCPMNWLHGKPRTRSPRPSNLSDSAWKASYCGVNPHLDATLTMSSALPWCSARVVSSPSSVSQSDRVQWGEAGHARSSVFWAADNRQHA